MDSNNSIFSNLVKYSPVFVFGKNKKNKNRPGRGWLIFKKFIFWILLCKVSRALIWWWFISTNQNVWNKHGVIFMMNTKDSNSQLIPGPLEHVSVLNKSIFFILIRHKSLLQSFCKPKYKKISDSFCHFNSFDLRKLKCLRYGGCLQL